ncbi:APC family permease [Blastococcus sp. CCUG 61487]|uniref:APC family permease n=1 Tax=Blastococcus sp. CCUG 61487 TaxID=1840703 RepID=UPI0010BFB5BC|nr:APC family permease [Blastococcus sp. CCUG 61487]TKJ28861.1 transporter [Blastococcus sp. CCUG 61487]
MDEPDQQPRDPSPGSPAPRLDRRLGTGDAVVVGLGAMLGAGAFVAFAPAAQAAGAGLLLGLAVAAAIAYCNATSSARLAALYPESGGTYVYGRERLGDFWGHLAGWGFVVGKTASCAAMALTVGHYVAPELARPVAVAAVVALTALNYFGVHKSALATRVIVGVVLAVLAAVVVAGLAGGDPRVAQLTPLPGSGVHGVLQAAGFLFFAFAGYARIATLGEEVRDPARTLPRAIPLALGITLAVYAALAVTVLAVLGPTGTAATPAPLVAVAEATPWTWLVPVVRAGAAIAAFGALLALILGVSRTVLAMSRDRHLPVALAAVHPRHRVPHRAQLAVGLVVIAVVLAADVRGAIGFSSVAVLAYYAVANASALTLDRDRGSRLVPALGLVGCLVVGFSLPIGTVLAGVGTLAAGALVWAARR